jgi:hypothetical protein
MPLGVAAPGNRIAYVTRLERAASNAKEGASHRSALWFAHSVMASYLQDASDPQTAYRRTSRQEIKYTASPPAAAARASLASRMRTWPERYRSKCLAKPPVLASRALSYVA